MTQGINCTVPRRGGIKRRREWSARMNHETDEKNQTLLNRFALAAIQRRSRPIRHLYGQLWYSSVCTYRRATRHTGSFVICCSINCQHSSQHMRTNRHIRTSYSSQLVSVRTSGYFKTWSRSTRDRENKFLTVCDLYIALSAELGSQCMQGRNQVKKYGVDKYGERAESQSITGVWGGVHSGVQEQSCWSWTTGS